MNISSAQKRFLRGLTHDIKPVVMVGARGMTDKILAEIEEALDHHELIKVKLRSDRATRTEWIRTIAARSGAELVHAIGQMASFYRRNPEKPVIDLPKG